MACVAPESLGLLGLISPNLWLHCYPAGSALKESIEVPGEVCAPHAIPGVLSQGLEDKEVDLCELGLWRQVGVRGRARECLHSAKGKGRVLASVSSLPTHSLSSNSFQMFVALSHSQVAQRTYICLVLRFHYCFQLQCTLSEAAWETRSQARGRKKG